MPENQIIVPYRLQLRIGQFLYCLDFSTPATHKLNELKEAIFRSFTQDELLQIIRINDIPKKIRCSDCDPENQLVVARKEYATLKRARYGQNPNEL